MCRMIELRDRAGFAVEAVAELPIGGERLREDLDGDRAIQTCVARFVDFAHAAGTECGLNFVGAEASAGGKSHAERTKNCWSAPYTSVACPRDVRFRTMCRRLATCGRGPGQPQLALAARRRAVELRPSCTGPRRCAARCSTRPRTWQMIERREPSRSSSTSSSATSSG
jgi:hypothetical protein